MKRSYHHGDLRRASLRATLEGLDEGAALSVRTVAQRLGVSHNALYRHFKSAEDLLGEAAALCLRSFTERLQASAKGTQDVLERCRLMCREYFDFAAAYPKRYDLMFATNAPLSTHASATEAGEEAFSLLIELARAVDASAPEATAFELWTLLHGTVELFKHAALPAKLGDHRAELIDRAVASCIATLERAQAHRG